ncbi:MAG: type II toxin-antitoxin system RelE/ParE family toxin [Eubacteriales bacterium]|nr:type II toxin-antitoxin system RelE/ParE family toxin [Eubacteriales bacterium]MDD4327648.1 type II toxin-antitoxin system RelE/ParE family toxin [Eubacteriales bacterium]
MQPQKSKLVFLEPAKEDILKIAAYHLEKSGPVSARRITDILTEAIDRLADFPMIGQIHPDPVLSAKGYRKLVAAETYVCVYKVFPDTVFVYRIVNGATDYPTLMK